MESLFKRLNQEPSCGWEKEEKKKSYLLVTFMNLSSFIYLDLKCCKIVQILKCCKKFFVFMFYQSLSEIQEEISCGVM